MTTIRFNQQHTASAQLVKKLYLICIALGILLLVFGCSKSDDNIAQTEEIPVNITLNITTLKMNVGDEEQLQVSGADGQNVIWSSSDHSVAAVENGTVTTFKGGEAVITVKVGSAEANCTLSVAPDFFVAGKQRTNGPNESLITAAYYWKNGVAFPLTDGSLIAGANAIQVVGNDIYVAGYEDGIVSFRPMLWKNGQPIPLGDGIKKGEAHDVFVVDGDVHVVGEEDGRAMYWKNGIATILPSIVQVSTATSIHVSNNDVYITGAMGARNDIDRRAVYWKNTEPNLLSNPASNAIANDIFIDENDIHITGTQFERAMYWKNGDPTRITNSEPYAHGNSIFVYQDDVYIAGYQDFSGNGDSSRLWKNGVDISPTFMPGGNSAAESVFVWNKDVHVLGGYNQYPPLLGRYWKNGQLETLETPGIATFKDIFVR